MIYTNATLQLPWTQYNDGRYGAVSYSLRGGRAYLRGLASLSSGLSLPSTIFTLPPAYRPVVNEIFPQPTLSASSYSIGAVYVLSTGEVKLYNTIGLGWLSFDGMDFAVADAGNQTGTTTQGCTDATVSVAASQSSFDALSARVSILEGSSSSNGSLAAQVSLLTARVNAFDFSSLQFTSASLQTSWSQYGDLSFGLASFALRAGRVYIQGSVMWPSPPSSLIFILPPAYRPAVSETFVQGCAATGVGYSECIIYFYQNGDVKLMAGAASIGSRCTASSSQPWPATSPVQRKGALLPSYLLARRNHRWMH
jgi:hypothetical protein